MVTRSALLMLVYNHAPDPDSLTRALNQVDCLVLIDNHSRPGVVATLREFAQSNPTRTVLIENDTNLGISRAYNRAVELVRGQGIQWVYFLDHDAVFGESLLVETRALWDRLVAEGRTPGLVVPIVTDDPSCLGTNLGIREQYSPVRSAITSGMLTTVDILASLGGFDERMFCEQVDLELSMRMRAHHLDVVRLNKVLILQKFEEKPRMAGRLSRFMNRLVGYRSRVRIAMDNANIYRTTSSVYSNARQKDLDWSIGYIGDKLHHTRFDMVFVRLVVKVERSSIKFAQKLGGPEFVPSEAQ
jgi:glycosyltransferase involved in cell wall biosynthesis